MKRSASPLVFLLLATLAIVGCAQPPTDVIEAARASVAAVEAEGTQYASSAYSSAQGAVQRMDAEVAAQAERFAMSRDYERATQLAGEAEAAAVAVTDAVEAEKQRLRGEATQAISDAESAIAEAREGLTEMSEEDAAAYLAELDEAEAAVAAAGEALASGDVSGAAGQAGSALQAASGVTSALAEMTAAAAAEEEEAEATGVPTEEDALRAIRGSIDIPRNVYVDGRMLAAGAYTVRLAQGSVAPSPGLEPGSSRMVEFVNDESGSVAVSGMAAAVPDAEMAEVTDGWYPRNQAYVDELLSGEYVRVWLNRDGVTYLVHATTSAP